MDSDERVKSVDTVKIFSLYHYPSASYDRCRFAHPICIVALTKGVPNGRTEAAVTVRHGMP